MLAQELPLVSKSAVKGVWGTLRLKSSLITSSVQGRQGFPLIISFPMPWFELSPGAPHPRNMEGADSQRGRVVSERRTGVRTGVPPSTLRHCNYITRWMPQPAWSTTRQDLLSLDSLRALQPSDRSGMRQRQGYTFSISRVLWRRLLISSIGSGSSSVQREDTAGFTASVAY